MSKTEREKRLEAALQDACNGMDLARRILQDCYRRQGWTEDEVRRHANWGLLETSRFRRALSDEGSDGGDETLPDTWMVVYKGALGRRYTRMDGPYIWRNSDGNWEISPHNNVPPRLHRTYYSDLLAAIREVDKASPYPKLDDTPPQRRDTMRWELDWMFKAAQFYFDQKGWDKNDLHRVHGNLRRALTTDRNPSESINSGEVDRGALEAFDRLVREHIGQTVPGIGTLEIPADAQPLIDKVDAALTHLSESADNAVADFIEDLCGELLHRGIDTSNWDGDAGPADAIASGIEAAIQEASKPAVPSVPETCEFCGVETDPNGDRMDAGSHYPECPNRDPLPESVWRLPDEWLRLAKTFAPVTQATGEDMENLCRRLRSDLMSALAQSGERVPTSLEDDVWRIAHFQYTVNKAPLETAVRTAVRSALAQSGEGRGPEAEELARAFHATYECLAPQYGYETREETREFDPESTNGQLMIAVCRVMREKFTAAPEPGESFGSMKRAMIATAEPGPEKNDD